MYAQGCLRISNAIGMQNAIKWYGAVLSQSKKSRVFASAFGRTYSQNGQNLKEFKLLIKMNRLKFGMYGNFSSYSRWKI